MAHQSKILPLKTEIASMEGQLSMLERFVEEAREEVGRAKQRESIQPAVVSSLERLQEQEHERAVGVFSRLLTALAKDVLPNANKPVVLDLYTAHGVPALDIDIAASDKFKEEITSGAIKNVLSVGLRLIAIARTNQRRFLVLDEPDHWIKTDNIPQFVSVLDRIIKDLGFQILMISHHQSSFFQAVAKCVNLSKEGDKMVVSGDLLPNPHEGLRAVRLVNFESHEDTVVPLHAGMTILTGENNIGKSSFIRGLKALLVGEMNNDRVIMHTPKEKAFSRVEIQLETGEWAGLRRARKITTTMRHKNRYYVRSNEDESLEEDQFLIAEDAHDGVPDFIQERTRIFPNEKWTIHVAAQEESVFLLNQTTKATERAKILALGNEAEVLHAMIERNRAESRKDKEIIRDGEKKLGSALRQMDGLKEKLRIASEACDRLTEEGRRLDQSIEQLVFGAELVRNLDQRKRDFYGWQQQLAVLRRVPNPPLLDGTTAELSGLIEGLEWTRIWSRVAVPKEVIAPVLRETTELAQVIARLKELSIKAKPLPDYDLPEPPQMAEVFTMRNFIDQLNQAKKNAESAKMEEAKRGEEMERISVEIKEAWGGVDACPLCGSAESAHQH